jgi:hypothetical protein
MQKHDTKGFKVGDKIRIVEMVGEPHYNGREGVIESIDDMGQLEGTWGGVRVHADEDTIERV